MGPLSGAAAWLCARGEEVGASDEMVTRAPRRRVVADWASEGDGLRSCFQMILYLCCIKYLSRCAVGLAGRDDAGPEGKVWPKLSGFRRACWEYASVA